MQHSFILKEVHHTPDGYSHHMRDFYTVDKDFSANSAMRMAYTPEQVQLMEETLVDEDQLWLSLATAGTVIADRNFPSLSLELVRGPQRAAFGIRFTETTNHSVMFAWRFRIDESKLTMSAVYRISIILGSLTIGAFNRLQDKKDPALARFHNCDPAQTTALRETIAGWVLHTLIDQYLCDVTSIQVK